MFEQLTSQMDFMSAALQLRSQRQQLIASNIANADTPGYAAHDFDFAKALRNAVAGTAGSAAVGNAGAVQTVSLSLPTGGGGALATDDPRHMPTLTDSESVTDKTHMGYAFQTQPSVDGNSVDMDQQRANFVDNTVRYQATLTFINSHVKMMTSAIQGQ